MGLNIRITPGAYLFAALLILLLPIRWWTGTVAAACVHELFHLSALWLLGGKALGIEIGPMGAKIETMPMESSREALIAAAGPVGSFLVSAFSPIFPEAALCGAVQGLFNLLPIFPLDGGRILHTAAPKPVCIGVEIFTLIFLLGLGCWASVNYNLGFLPLLPAMIAAKHAISENFLAKKG